MTSRGPGSRIRQVAADGPQGFVWLIFLAIFFFIPYGLLINVMFSAKQKEAGFKRFRLIVQKSATVSGK